MEDKDVNFDNQVPASETAQSQTTQEATVNNRERTSLKDMANNCVLVNYEYVKSLKQEGHTSIADLIFKEGMEMCCSSNLSAEAIGRNRFVEYLERGYYSSGRLLVYLEFSKSIGVADNVREALADSVTGIHKIFGASLNTVRAKAKAQTEKVPI